VRWLAEKCSNIQATSEQIAIGIYCLEEGLTDKARQHFNYAKSSAKTAAEKDEVKRLLDEVPPAPKPTPSPRAEAPTPAPPPVVKSAPSSPPKTSIERRIKDLGTERRWSEILSLVSGTLRERPEDPDLMISAGIAVTEAMEQSMGPKPAGAKKSPLANWTKGLLSRGLQLDPTHPRAAEAQQCLAYLTKIIEEDERRP
jgi:hypothetical protein